MESGRGSGGGGGGGGGGGSRGGGLNSSSGGKKMRKRKELDALVVAKRGCKRRAVDQLLSDTTEEEEDFWPPGKGSCKRSPGGGGSGYQGHGKRDRCRPLIRFCTGLLVIACAVTTLTVVWLFIDIREQTTFLRNQLDQVAAGSQGVPDALQKCHSLSRQLQTNQTLLFSQLASLSHHVENITAQVGSVQGGLANVEEKLTASPELINVPHDVRVLSTSVTSFGSQIQDLQTSFNHLKEEQSNLLKIIDTLRVNVTLMNNTIQDFMKKSSSVINETNVNNAAVLKEQTMIESMKSNIMNISEQFSQQYQYLKDDQHKDHMEIESLNEMSANISSRLTTLQNECSAKFVSLESLAMSVNNVSNQIHLSSSKFNEISDEVKNMRMKLSDLINSIHLPTSDDQITPSVQNNTKPVKTTNLNDTTQEADSNQ